MSDIQTNLQGNGEADASLLKNPNLDLSKEVEEQTEHGGQGDFTSPKLREAEEEWELAPKRFRSVLSPKSEGNESPGGREIYPLSSIPSDAFFLEGVEDSICTSSC